MTDQIQIVEAPTKDNVNAANETLFQMSATFPFQLFPDQIILDRLKINIIKKNFFASSQITTLPLSNTISVKVNSNPFFSQVEISDTNLRGATTFVRHLRKDDAMKFKTLVQGIVIGMNQGIDLMSMTSNELVEATQEWGSVDAEA
jgi:hypothetical protein